MLPRPAAPQQAWTAAASLGGPDSSPVQTDATLHRCLVATTGAIAVAEHRTYAGATYAGATYAGATYAVGTTVTASATAATSSSTSRTANPSATCTSTPTRTTSPSPDPP
ncbi:hypothetical protein Areg01_18660 [Actinoplanes regularis]|nr:hypothetical protein Areg01_18660 [Actinoplanes regularis]